MTSLNRYRPVALLSLTLIAGTGSLDAREDTRMEETRVRAQEKSLTYQLPERSERHRVQRSVTVGFADLDLERPAGLDTLYLRLEEATALVCGPREDGRNLALHRDQQQCRGTAMDKAVAAIGHLGLDDLHLARSGRSSPHDQSVAAHPPR